MKGILICPGQRPSVMALSQAAPLSHVPILGKCLVEYWIEHLAARGARQIYVLCPDRLDHMRRLLSTGARWGVTVTVIHEPGETTAHDALKKYREGTGWMDPPDAANMMDHVPGFSDLRLFESYSAFVEAQKALMLRAAPPARVGLREIRPSVWVGLRTRVAPSAHLVAPCWIGEDVFIGSDAVIGPMAVVHNGSMIRNGADITHSVLGPDTFVGEHVTIRNSIAWGATLIHYGLSSCIQVRDAFLLSSLAPPSDAAESPGIFDRLAAACAPRLALPRLALPRVTAPIRRAMARIALDLGPQLAATPAASHDDLLPTGTVRCRNWFRHWPQVRSFMDDTLAWINHRPFPPQFSPLAAGVESLAPPAPAHPARTDAGGQAFTRAANVSFEEYKSQAGRDAPCPQPILNLRGLRELNTEMVRLVRGKISMPALKAPSAIEIDLSDVECLDSFAVSILASLHRVVTDRNPGGNIPVRLANPRPAVRQMLELTRMHHLFEIVSNDGEAAGEETVANPNARAA